MSIDQRVVTSLNHWGVHHLALVKFASNDLVYALIGIAAIWFLYRSISERRSKDGTFRLTINLVRAGSLLLVAPVALATIASELISQVYVRQRPFVTMPGIKLLVPHGADGGMPSHHMVFMVAVAVMVYSVDRKVGYLLFVITGVTAIARVTAGIHYPSDILAGILLGWAVPTIYLRLVRTWRVSRESK
jgi:membrane-associated phospholipid phosphatase